MARLEAVNVYLRLRANEGSGQQSKSGELIEVLGDGEVQIKQQHPKRFSFNKVFTARSSQAVIYQSVVAPLVDKVLGGYTCTLLTYGQSGSGKTYTLFGDVSDHNAYGSKNSPDGCVPRALISILDEIKKLSGNIERTVRVSYLELFNEELVDLLHDNSEPSQPLRIHEDPEQKGNMYIENLSAYTICDACDIKKIINLAEENRSNCSMLENAESRSHKVFIVNVYTRTVTLPGEENLTCGKMFFVKVAGCENLRPEKRGRRENLINQSLVTLTNVIQALEERNSYVPRSESKLTKILQESFGGRSSTAVIATISPTRDNIKDTLTTLQFARAAKTIRNHVQMNKITTKSNVVNCLSAELTRLEKDLNALRTATGYFVDAENYNNVLEQTNLKKEEIDAKEKQIMDMKERIRELEATKLFREKELKSLNESFEFTKTRAIMYKKKLLNRRAQTEKVKDVAEVAQKAGVPVLKQNDELKCLTQKSTDHYKILKNRTKTVQETLQHNNLLRQDVCKNIVNSFSKMVQSLEEDKDELSECIMNQCSDLNSIAELLTEQSFDGANKIRIALAELQDILKSYAADNIMKTNLKDNVDAFTNRRQECFNYFDMTTTQLEEKQETLENLLKEDAEQYETFNRQQLSSVNAFDGYNKDLTTSAKMQNDFLTEISKTLTEFQADTVSNNNKVRENLEACSEIAQIFEQFSKTYKEDQILNSDLTEAIAKSQSSVENRKGEIEKNLEMYSNLIGDINECANIINEEEKECSPISVFDNDVEVEINIIKQKMLALDKLLKEDTCSLGNYSDATAISTDITKQLETFCQNNIAISTDLNETLSFNVNEFMDSYTGIEAHKNVLRSDVSEILNTLAESVSMIFEEPLETNQTTDIANNKENFPPILDDLPNMGSEDAESIRHLLQQLKKLQERFN